MTEEVATPNSEAQVMPEEIKKSKDPNFIRNPISRAYIKKNGSTHQKLMEDGIIDKEGKSLLKKSKSKKLNLDNVYEDKEPKVEAKVEPVDKPVDKPVTKHVDKPVDKPVTKPVVPKDDEIKKIIKTEVCKIVKDHSEILSKLTEEEREKFIHGLLVSRLITE